MSHITTTPYFVSGSPGGAFGSGQAVITGGYNVIATVDKYAFTDDTMTSGTDLNTATQSHCGCGPATFGLLVGGLYVYTFMQKYNYADDVVTTPVAAFTQAMTNARGTGNDTLGIVAGQASGGSWYKQTHKIQYSVLSAAVSTVLGTAHEQCASFENPTRGYWAGGRPGASLQTNIVDKYTFADDTTAASGNIGLQRNSLDGTGNETHGYAMGGYYTARVASVDKYSYASETYVPATSLHTVAASHYCTSNKITGLLSGSGDGASYFSIRYHFGTEASTQSAALSTPVTFGVASTSDSHAGLA